MAQSLPILDVGSLREWRGWLVRHHRSSPGVWLVFPKGHTGLKAIAYEDAVCEALCFGWIDSLVKRLDADRYARKFTPRRPSARWSEINRKRWARLEGAGRLEAAGRAASPTGRSYPPAAAVPELPAYIARGLKPHPNAWRFFRELPPSARRQFVLWIHTARRLETRAKRIRESVALLAAGKRLGLK